MIWAFTVLLGTAWAGPEGMRPPPEGWTDLDTLDGVQLEIRYHTADNFTGAPLPGYGVPAAWLRDGPAQALLKVQRDLAAQGYGLRVYDAYRPLRGTLAMVAWATRTHQTHLLDEGYIARRSNHNRGNTVDLTLVDLATGQPVDMGTPWDTLTTQAHTRNATGSARQHRDLLVQAMRAHGWINYWKEWWHFTWQPDAKPAHRDVPYGCQEPDEGAWKPPTGWSAPGYTPPPHAPPTAPCTPPEGP